MGLSNIFINSIATIKSLAARLADTPSAWRGDVKGAVKDVIEGKHLEYKEAIPSQRTYIFGEQNFPKSKQPARIDASLPQYDVNFGLDTLEIPKRDSTIIAERVGIPAVKAQSGPGPYFTWLTPTDYNKKHFYDAGKFTIIPERDQYGNYYMNLSDVYDFKGANEYLKKYGTPRGSDEKDFSKDPLAKLAVTAMQFIGQPYEVHARVPIKFVEKNPDNNIDQWNSSFGGLRAMFQNIADIHNVKFKIPLEQVPEDELESKYLVQESENVTGDDFVEFWKKSGLLKEKQGGKLNYLNYCI